MNIEEADLLEAIRARRRPARRLPRRRQQPHAPGFGALDWDAIVRELQGIGYAGHLTVEFVPALDRAAHIGDASEAGGSARIEKFLRDHATGAVPEELYERYTADSIGTCARRWAPRSDAGRRADRHARHQG